ncbi:MAG: xylan 1,4-beta-xylosidase [Chthoniobacter sp.]|jgi:xylan 1,4-beta-xylosidase|nr:xylan 1,4-beta-xylosidase [Chthoniobacter sp.]
MIDSVRKFLRLLVCVLGVRAFSQSSPVPAESPASSFPVSVSVDAAKTIGAMKPIWRFFGADESNYATMKYGKQLIGELGKLRPGQTFFRAHNLLCTGDGTPALKWGSTNVYTEDAEGRPVYDWRIVDEIFDTYLARGVRPYAQIGFMPKALSVHPEPYQHHWTPDVPYDAIITGWAYPPRDYDKWRELSYQWAKHCIERYGRDEVEQWYWEVWNEPNGSYWKATPEEFYKLHDYAIDGIRRALPTARVGGPDVAGSGGKFMQNFMTHCVSGTNYATGQTGTPTDFLAFHAKGSPKFVDGHVRMGISSQLEAIDRGFAMIAAIPELKAKPIVIGESDPDGCAACQGPQLGYRAGTMYSSYTAASFAREYTLADKHGVNLDGALTWAFEFEDQPYFAGQRVLATNGLDLPVLNVFRMFSRMGGDRVETKSSGEISLEAMKRDGVRGQPDVAALSSLEGKKLCVLLWHYHDDDVQGPDAAIELALAHLPLAQGEARLTHLRIDEDHSNAFTAWKQLGSPAQPSPEQYAQLEKAGKLMAMADAPKTVPVVDGAATLKFTLPRQAVSLLVLEWDSASK